jgi:hypothetical protein
MENNGFTKCKSLIKERQDLILKGEENGFVFKNGLLYKRTNSAEERYICFELEEYYGNNVLKCPKFGLYIFPIKGFNSNPRLFDTYDTVYAYSIITSVFDSIVNFFQDGKNILEKYTFSYRVIKAELHVIFATNDGDKITFSSSGRYFRGRLIRNSEEENNDLYGV